MLGARRGRAVRPLAIGLVALGGAAAIPAGVALAASSGSVTETISVGPQPTLSVTVSPASASLCSSAPLTFPNGACNTPAITITNGTAPAIIDVNGGDAIPTDGGTHWTLCGPVPPTAPTMAPQCTASGIPAANPGQDQYNEVALQSPGPGLTDLSDSPQCDDSFAATCASGGSTPANHAVTEMIDLLGPSGSTDTSSTFNSSVTWTAVAP
jgi:hypothetical protein